MPDLRHIFGTQVRQVRKARGLTQAQLAELCDLSIDMVGRIERGDAAPSFDTIEKLVEALQAPAPTLFGGLPLVPDSTPGRDRALSRIIKRVGALGERELEWIDRVLVAVLRR